MVGNCATIVLFLQFRADVRMSRDASEKGRKKAAGVKAAATLGVKRDGTMISERFIILKNNI